MPRITCFYKIAASADKSARDRRHKLTKASNIDDVIATIPTKTSSPQDLVNDGLTDSKSHATLFTRFS